MGCFSYICKVSGLAATSTSFDGSPVRLQLLFDGEVIEEMVGNYNSYGGVFDLEGGSFSWATKWFVDLHFDRNERSGVALVLLKYDTGQDFSTRSEDDPMQGWGEDGELMGNTSSGQYRKVESPYHKVYRKITEEDLGSYEAKLYGSTLASIRKMSREQQG